MSVGIAAGILVIFINLLIGILAERSLAAGFQILIASGIFLVIVPFVVGVQAALLAYTHINRHRKRLSKADKAGVAGSTTSSLAMVACCLHHVADALPAIGVLLTAATFLTQFKDLFLVLGLIASVVGSSYLIRTILKEKL